MKKQLEFSGQACEGTSVGKVNPAPQPEVLYLQTRTLMKMLPTPDLRKEGSLCAHIMRMGLPFST